MPYTQLKEKLEQLLTEDLSNRHTLQEARRNLFLNSEGSKVQQQVIEQKQSEILSLNTLVEKKKTIVQLKDDEITSLRNKIAELEEKVLSAEINLEEERKVFGAKVAEMNTKVESSTDLENKLTELSLQNEEYSAKIRELIYHIDSQNTEIENLKKDVGNKAETDTLMATLMAAEQELKSRVALQNTEIETLRNELTSAKEETAVLKATPVVDTKELENKVAELEQAKERADLLADSEQQLKVLVSSQNNDIDTLTKANNALKKQTEDIAAGWQQQQEQLLSDNSNLLAELALLKENTITAEVITPAPIAEEQIAAIVAEKEQLGNKLEAYTAELTVLKETLNTAAPVAAQAISDEDLQGIRLEKERLLSEMNAIKHELDMNTQIREEKIMLLQAEINTLQNQVLHLSDSLNNEAEQKNEIGTQLEQLTSIVAEKEQKLNEMAKNDANEEFIDKLMFQANRLNDEKHRFEMLYTETEAELTLTNTNLANLTQLIEEQKNSISGLEKTKKHVKYEQTLMLQASDKTAAKQAINELVREIDRCIALLSE